MLTPWKESYDQPTQHIQKQRHYFANKGPSSQGYGFSSSHVWMWELDYKESWVLKNWCLWTVVLEKTLESPLDCKIKPVHPKGHQSWVLVGWCWRWESHFLGRLIRSLGVPKKRGVWNSQGERKDKLFFPSLHSLGLYNNNVSCLRTVSGLNLLANSVVLKCKLWE